MSEIDRATRLAIALYPQRWRDEYATPIVSTLLDVAEAEGRSRPAPVELAVLAARGSWLRARTAPTFWGGLVMFGCFLGTTRGFPSWWFGASTERYWTAAVGDLGEALPFVLPIAGLLAAWQAWRRTRRRMSRIRVSEMARDLAPIVAWLVLGSAASVGFWFAAGGWPVTANLDWRYVVAFSAMGLGTACAGYALGRLLPVGPAVLVVSVASVLWWWSAWGLTDLAWRNLTGFNFVNYRPTEYGTAPDTAFVASSVIGCAQVVLGLALVLSPRLAARVAAVVVVVAVIVALAVAHRPLTQWAGTRLYAHRDRSELVCADRICLWPEQQAQDGRMIRATLAAASRRAVAFDLPAPAGISVSPESKTEVPLRLPVDATRDDVISEYADEYAGYLGCRSNRLFTDDYDDDRMAAALAMVVVFGGTLRHSPYEVMIGSRTLTAAQLSDRYGVHNRAEAQSVAKAWVLRGPQC